MKEENEEYFFTRIGIVVNPNLGECTRCGKEFWYASTQDDLCPSCCQIEADELDVIRKENGEKW